jgi:hypothetical protein
MISSTYRIKEIVLMRVNVSSASSARVPVRADTRGRQPKQPHGFTSERGQVAANIETAQAQGCHGVKAIFEIRTNRITYTHIIKNNLASPPRKGRSPQRS